MGKSSSKNLDPTTEAARTCLIRGKKLFRSSNYHEAIKAVEKALELKPDYSEALFLKGRCLGRLNKNEEALNWYDKAIQLGHVGACNFKGFLVTNKQDSMELFKKALQLNKNPSNATKLINKGLSLEGLEKFTEAIQYYDKAIRIRPNYDLAHFNKGNTLWQRRKLEIILLFFACLFKTVHMQILHVYYYFKGFALFNLRKYEKAIKCFDKALNINPNDESTYTAKGASLSNLGK